VTHPLQTSTACLPGRKLHRVDGIQCEMLFFLPINSTQLFSVRSMLG
jgi:hypothetical protein